jgi:hypothetical protein
MSWTMPGMFCLFLSLDCDIDEEKKLRGRTGFSPLVAVQNWDFLNRHNPPNALFQFTKICKSPRLTVMFSGIKICVSSSVPIRQYPQLALIQSNNYLLFISIL